jgi:uncharacterized surface anchored protein
VDTWTSDESGTHTFTVANGTYQFVETSVPSGYVKADDVAFTMATNGTVTVDNRTLDAGESIVMTNSLATIYYPVYLDKQDGTGNALSGATIQLQTAYGAPLQTWISDGSRHTYYLPSGSYQLVETAAPEGYQLAEKIVFTVDGAGRITIGGTTSNAPIVMIDQPETALNPQDETSENPQVPGETPENPQVPGETPENPEVPSETAENPETPDDSETAGLSEDPSKSEEPETLEDPAESEEPSENSAESEEPETAEFEEFGDSPKTDDLTTIWIAIPMIFACLGGIVLVLRKKKNI